MLTLVTGATGFVVVFLCKILLETTNHDIIGVENISNYYSVSSLEERSKMLSAFPYYKFIKSGISDKSFADKLFNNNTFYFIAYITIQTRFKYSINYPYTYKIIPLMEECLIEVIRINVVGAYNVVVPALWDNKDLITERDKYHLNDIRLWLSGWVQRKGRNAFLIVKKTKLDEGYTKKINFWIDTATVFKIYSSPYLQQ